MNIKTALAIKNISYSREKCPMGIEAKHNFLSEKREKEFCDRGCSTICFDEYMDLEVGRGKRK